MNHLLGDICLMLLMFCFTLQRIIVYFVPNETIWFHKTFVIVFLRIIHDFSCSKNVISLPLFSLGFHHSL